MNTRKLLVICLSIAIGMSFLGLPTVQAEIAPYPTAPLCPTHNDRAYHGLWDPIRGCHYNHTHGDDPHALDSLFDDDIYAEFGGEISYPHQTYSSAGTENELKHEGYYWIVRTGLPCPGNPVIGTTCITDFRTEIHQHADGHDAPVRRHSFLMQTRSCVYLATGWLCGTSQMGGWQDSGDLLVNGSVAIDVPDNLNCHKQHRSTDGSAVWYPCFRYGEFGIEGFGRSSVAIHNQWDRTSATSPEVYTDTICYGSPTCTMNGTFLRPHLIKVDIPNLATVESILDPDGNNIVENFDGFTTQYGVIDLTCTDVSAVCVPLKFENVSTDYAYIYRDTDPGRSYDIWFCGSVQCTATSPGRRTSNWAQPHH